MGTKETFYVTKESISHRICLEHQYGRRFIVLLHQYGRRDVTEYSLPRPSSFEGWSRDRAKSSEVIKENEMTSWRKSLYQPPDACDHRNPLHYSCHPSNLLPHAMINDLLNIVFFAEFSLNANF